MKNMLFIFCLFIIQFVPFTLSQTAKEIVQKADELMRSTAVILS